MNKKFKRVISSLLAFVMLCSCMMVANVSSVMAADYTGGVTKTTNGNVTTWDFSTINLTSNQNLSANDTVYGIVFDVTKANLNRGKYLSVTTGAIKLPIKSTTTSGTISVTAQATQSRSLTFGTSGNIPMDKNGASADFTSADVSDGYITLTATGGEIKALKIELTENGGSVVDPTESTTEAQVETTTEAPTETTTSAPVLTGIDLVDSLSYTGTASYNADTNVGNFTIIPGSGVTLSVDANSKTANGGASTHRLKLGGTGGVDKRAVKFTTAEANTKVYVWALSTGSSERTLNVLDANGNVVGTIVAPTSSTTVIPGGSVDLPTAGTYYVCSAGSGINIYLMGTDKALVTVSAEETTSEATTEAQTEATTEAPTEATTTAPVADGLAAGTYEANSSTFDRTNSTSTFKGVSNVVLDNTGSDHIRLKTNCGFDVTPAVSGTLTLVMNSNDNGAVVTAADGTVLINTNANSGTDHTYTYSVEAGKTYTIRGASSSASRLTQFKLEAGSVATTATLNFTQSGTAGTITVNGEVADSAKLYTIGEAVTIAVTAVPTGYSLKSVVANGTTLTAGTDGTYSYTVAATNNITVTYEKVATPVTVTVYDSVTRTPITTTLYYWTTTGERAADGKRVTNEHKVNDTNGVINVTAIANGDADALSHVTGDSVTADTAKTDMGTAITNKNLYVTADNHAGAVVAIPENGNVNVLLTPLAEVNISKDGIYTATANDIIEALLTETALYSYQNPYIKEAIVNGFDFTATGNQIFKVMQTVNTRNAKNSDGSVRNLIQASDGCTIKYTAPANGNILIKAANASSNASAKRGYNVAGSDGFTGTSSDLTSTAQPASPAAYPVVKDATYTITVYAEKEDGTINFGSIEFVPNEVTKYTVTLTNDAANGSANATVGGVALESGTAYEENSEVVVSVTPNSGKQAVVRVNGNIVNLTGNAYTFTLRQDTTIDVTYENEDVVVEDQLVAMMVGDKVDFNAATDLSRQNTAYTGSYKVKYYADAVTGGGKTHVIKLKNNDATNFIEVMAGEDGNMVVNFNTNGLIVKDSAGNTVATLARSEDKASADISRSFEVKAKERYTIVATGGNSYVNYVELLDANTRAGENVAVVSFTETGLNDAATKAYAGDAAPEKLVRIVGELTNITENNQELVADVSEIGIAVFNCSFAELNNMSKDDLDAETSLAGKLAITTVYPSVYDSSAYAENTALTADSKCSALNSYFDVAVFGNTADFAGKSYCTYTVKNGTTWYYNSEAKLSGADF